MDERIVFCSGWPVIVKKVDEELRANPFAHVVAVVAVVAVVVHDALRG